ncbi:cyclin-dependent kinase inhibitor 7-like [Pyrus x bretschneideri]|uniref:cyclin-dependent kinase inhibitor 7-like n=1 Tax=Pyrus x bretschneideri TaxID=225117 RepID=UPI00202FF956|nr:cyclin-dependent kinase inhibitor 7-like [Pyrus x bretschneideri]
MAAMDNSTTAAVSKRRKITASTPPLPPLPPSPIMLQLLDSPHSCSSFYSDHSPPPSSCCSTNDLNDVAAARSSPLLDLQVNPASIARTEIRISLPLSFCLKTRRQIEERETSEWKTAKSFETAFSNSTSITNNKFRETTPSSELSLDLNEMSSPAPAVSHRRRIPVSKSTPSEEIEEFFAAAEKYEHKRFTEKFNYDIVNDVPLEGRYQWVRLKS